MLPPCLIRPTLSLLGLPPCLPGPNGGRAEGRSPPALPPAARDTPRRLSEAARSRVAAAKGRAEMTRNSHRRAQAPGLGLALGAAIGVALGTLVGGGAQVAAGVVIGAALGLLIGAAVDVRGPRIAAGSPERDGGEGLLKQPLATAGRWRRGHYEYPASPVRCAGAGLATRRTVASPRRTGPHDRDRATGRSWRCSWRSCRPRPASRRLDALPRSTRYSPAVASNLAPPGRAARGRRRSGRWSGRW